MLREREEYSILPVMDRQFFGCPARRPDTILAEQSNKQGRLRHQLIIFFFFSFSFSLYVALVLSPFLIKEKGSAMYE